jgi:DNA-binding MarR family transcriptional regulator
MAPVPGLAHTNKKSKTGTNLQTTVARGWFRTTPAQGTEMSAHPERHWTFLSNHAHVLVCLASDPDLRLRDVAARVGITERAVQGIVGDLETAGVILRERAGRRNSYRLNLDAPLRHPLEAHRPIRALLALILEPAQIKRLPTTAAR